MQLTFLIDHILGRRSAPQDYNIQKCYICSEGSTHVECASQFEFCSADVRNT